MSASKHESAPTLKSDLGRLDSHITTPDEYEELPEMTSDMLRRGTVKRAGRPVATDPRRQVTIRVPQSVLSAWKASGPGWQTRMAELLSKRAP